MLRGVQEPRVRLAPHAHSNSWEDVVDLMAAYGLSLDEWQENVLEGALGEQRGGRWAAPRVGVSVPRQNGKGALIEARELAGLLLFGERLIIHSAHEVKTSLDAFRRVRAYFENFDDLRKKVRRVVQTNGQEGIELVSGQALRFMARSKGSGRGFSADCLILDEAQELSDDTFAAILPTISARPNPQTWLLGTPPSPLMNGEVFSRFRNGGLEGKDARLFWAEWSCGDDVDLDDPRGWSQANPALGVRIDVESIRDERSAMDDDTFARERLGMWSGSEGRAVIPPGLWAEVADEQSAPALRFTLAVDVAPDRERASVALAGQRADGLWHVEVDEHRSGDVAWIVPWVVSRCERNDIRAVVVDGASPAASMIDEFAQRRVRVTTSNARDMAAACGSFYDAVLSGSVRHTDQPQLNSALSAARKRPLGDSWAWNRKGAGSDITPLVACTLALWGAQKSTVRRPMTRRRDGSSGRRAVVL